MGVCNHKPDILQLSVTSYSNSSCPSMSRANLMCISSASLAGRCDLLFVLAWLVQTTHHAKCLRQGFVVPVKRLPGRL